MFPWAGVLVVGSDYEAFAEAIAGDWLSNIDALLAWNHGSVHFLQGLGSQALHNHGLRLLNAGRDALAAPDDPATAQRFTREADFLTQTGEGGLSTWDLLEAAATVEARRLIPQAAWTSPPQAGPAFDLLVAHLGEEDAGELCAFLTFFALLTGEPTSTFASLAEAAAQQADTWKGVGAAEVLDQLDWGDEFDSYWDRVSAGEPVGTPYLADPLREGMRRIGRSRLLELLARPSAHLHELEEHELRSILPPVIVYPSRDGGLVHHLNGVALDDGGQFARDALADVGVYGAAWQLGRRSEAAYCHHVACPHHHTGLCHQYFNPPDNETGHDGCGFIPAFAAYAGQDPATTWSRFGERAAL